MNILVAALVLLSLSLAVACNEADVRGSGDLVTEEYDFEDFTKVDISNTFRADIRQSDTFSVSVEVDDNVLELIEVTQDGDTLRLRLESGTGVSNATIEATITMPEIVALNVSGASRATVTGFENLGAFDVQVSGASEAEGVLDVTRLNLHVSGASKASFEGGGVEADLRVSGASSVDLENFLLEIASVNISGASNATVHVSDELGPVDVSGASRLRYLGQPSLSGVETAGASRVEPAD